MKNLELESVDQFHGLFRAFRSHNGFGSWFRGQANSNWDLLPKAGRHEYYLPDNRDIGRFTDWERQAVAYQSLPENRLERLALAQHHGLATRLLDWTQNPLVAAYFSVIEQPEHDGAIYVLEVLDEMINEQTSFELIENHVGVISYIPRSFTPRVLNQKGMFTIHCPPSKLIDVTFSRVSSNLPNLIKIVVRSDLKSDIEIMLNDYGINSSTLFPDLDGLSLCKNMETRKMAEKARNKPIQPNADASTNLGVKL